MKMRYRKTGFVFALVVAALSVQAQYRGTAQGMLQYTVGIPMGSFKNTVSDASPRGFRAAIYFGINDNLALGGGAGYQDFYQKVPRQLYPLSDGGDLSAVRSFSIQTIPVLFESKWNFSPGKPIQPYAGLGIGGNLISYNDYAGEFGMEQKTSFGFAARPHAGVYIPFRKHGETGLAVGASYSIMPFSGGDVSNLNHVSMHAGITIPLRK